MGTNEEAAMEHFIEYTKCPVLNNKNWPEAILGQLVIE